MAVDLKWHDACNASRAFDAAEKAAGWPKAMTASQIAALQRPHAYGDVQGRRARVTLQGALEAACEFGELACITETEQVPVRHDYFESNDSGAPYDWRAQGFKRKW